MEPAFYRGDILFLTNPTSVDYAIGDITVYKVYVVVQLALRPPSTDTQRDSYRPGGDIPIVHRVIETHKR